MTFLIGFFIWLFQAGRIEQELVETIIENKKIEFPEEYDKMHYLLQIAEKVTTENKSFFDKD